MIDNDKYLETLITNSFSNFGDRPNIIWKSKNKQIRNAQEYYTIVPVTEKKYLYIVLTKRYYNKNDINIYLDCFYTTKSNRGTTLSERPRGLPDDFRFSNIKLLFVKDHPLLVKLYAVIKYNNYVNATKGKYNWVEDMIIWTNEMKIPWFEYKHESSNPEDKPDAYICYDMRDKFGFDITIRVTKWKRLVVSLDGRMFHNINNIYLKDDALYNAIRDNI